MHLGHNGYVGEPISLACRLADSLWKSVGQRQVVRQQLPHLDKFQRSLGGTGGRLLAIRNGVPMAVTADVAFGSAVSLHNMRPVEGVALGVELA